MEIKKMKKRAYLNFLLTINLVIMDGAFKELIAFLRSTGVHD